MLEPHLYLLFPVVFVAGVIDSFAGGGGLFPVPAYLLGGFGLFVMWFWLLRVAHTAPPATSAKAGRYFGLWAPLFAVVLFGGWIVGQYYAMPHIARLLHMSFSP